MVTKNFGTPSNDDDDMEPAELEEQANSIAPNEPTYLHTNEVSPAHSADDIDFSRLLPIKISWNTKISLETSTPEETPNKPNKHPFMVKLATLLNHINEGETKPVTIMSSKSKIQLTAPCLLENWTTNDIKKHSEYISFRYDRIKFTMWVKMQERANIWALKTPIIQHLIKHNIQIDRHSAPMHDVHTTFIGWFRNDHHPDTTHYPTL